MNGQDVRVGPRGTINFTVPAGKLKIVYDSVQKEFDITPGQWIYNPGEKRHYMIVTSAYTLAGGFSDDPETPSKDLGSREFFRVTTDYLFEIPETITAKYSGTRTTLMHY